VIPDARGEVAAPHHTAGQELPITVIEPRRDWALPHFPELWRYRELFFFFALRDIKLRYKQTFLGAGWAVAQPLMTMGVFALFLGRLGGISNGVEHYALFVFAGMVAWTFFGNTVTFAAGSVVANERLVTKIFFPRLIIPLSAVGAGFFDLAVATILLAGMNVYFGVTPGWSAVMLPVAGLFLGVASVGVGVLLSALIVAQRDFKYVLTFGVQLWMFATPSIYLPVESLGPRAQLYMPLNPAYGLVMAFRQAALGEQLDWYAFGVSATVGTAVAVAGMLYFRRVERSFADLI